MTTGHKPKMAPRADAPAGIETDGEGRVIPVEKRTLEDQIAATGSIKNPNAEAENPAPMPVHKQ